MKSVVKILLFIAFFAIVILFASCSAVKNINCKHSVLLPVTFVNKNGSMYTLQVPFCDTIYLNKEALPDSITLKTKIKTN